MVSTATKNLMEANEAELERDTKALDEIMLGIVSQITNPNQPEETFKRLFDESQWLTITRICDKYHWKPVGEIHRRLKVLKGQAMAEDSAMRASAQRRLEAAETALAKRGPRIVRQRADLEAELNGLQDEERAAREVVDVQQKGLLYLRGAAPKYLVDRHQRLMKELAARGGGSDSERAEVDAILDCYGR